ncbi:MAG: hypothetical protein PHD79_09465 [Aliarcobacter sp.]|nr:hypothetical protein [Aliarcobacter sp.]
MSEIKLPSIYKMEYKYFVLFLSFLFALDIFNLIAYNKNIVDMLINVNIFKEISLLFIVIYMFVMIIIFPIFRHIIKSITTYKYKDKYNQENDKDYKYLFIVKKQAIIEENDFLLSRVKEKEIKNKEAEKDSSIDFSLGLLVIIDLIFYGNSIFYSVCNYIQDMTGLLHFTCVSMGIIFIAVVGFWFVLSLFPYKIDKIYLPDKEIEN